MLKHLKHLQHLYLLSLCGLLLGTPMFASQAWAIAGGNAGGTPQKKAPVELSSQDKAFLQKVGRTDLLDKFRQASKKQKQKVLGEIRSFILKAKKQLSIRNQLKKLENALGKAEQAFRQADAKKKAKLQKKLDKLKAKIKQVKAKVVPFTSL